MFLAQKPAVLKKLVEIAKVQSAEASNKIEGIVTTSTRLKHLCEEKVLPRNQDEEEISGYRDTLNIIRENFEYIPITPNNILQLHGMLYRYSGCGIGGRFKNVQPAYRDFEDRANMGDGKLPAAEQVRRAVKMKIGKFTKSEIMELCPV